MKEEEILRNMKKVYEEYLFAEFRRTMGWPDIEEWVETSFPYREKSRLGNGYILYHCLS